MGRTSGDREDLERKKAEPPARHRRSRMEYRAKVTELHKRT